MDWYLKVIKNYAGFDGRARRQEYWMFFLINLVISVALGRIDSFAGFTYGMGFGILSTIYSLAIFIPSLAVAVRRMHDIGKSWTMLLVVLIPFVGWIWLIVLLAKEGVSGDNQYGPDPKQIVVE